jgi:hypothetical protein
LLPCICFEGLDKNSKRSFSIALKRNYSFCNCPLNYCPFGVRNRYYLLCPNYLGIGDNSLSFMRNLSTGFPFSFTLQPTGIHRLLSQFHSKPNELFVACRFANF